MALFDDDVLACFGFQCLVKAALISTYNSLVGSYETLSKVKLVGCARAGSENPQKSAQIQNLLLNIMWSLNQNRTHHAVNRIKRKRIKTNMYMPRRTLGKKNPALKEPGEKPFCCHTTRHPLREEKRGAIDR
jgi:hypothetical protein